MLFAKEKKKEKKERKNSIWIERKMIVKTPKFF